MTESLVRLADTLTAPPPDTPVGLLQGLVVSLGPPIRVDVGAMQLSCITLVGVSVGQAVYVLQSGGVNVILGAEQTDQYRHADIFGVTNASSQITLTFATPFPAACDGVVVQQTFAGTGTAFAHVVSLSATAAVLQIRSAATAPPADTGAGFTYVGRYWAWGH